MRMYKLRLPSPALIVACVALFAALGGGSYAATTLANSGVHWTSASLQNGWQKGCCDPGTPGYAKDSAGVVHLRGAIADGTSNFAFTLPKALRPAHDLYITDYTFEGTTGYLIIYKDGEVWPEGTYATDYSSLNGISFVAGQ